ncbi:MAG TPA: pitrilysin family protein [Chitinophagales bacterium]|nr:pitrilysin family protein [Chitinophagales bacterium]
MIQFKKANLSNGLRVIVHEDSSTPLAAVNILYNVGSRDESPDQTGFAHLFEHLMFGGSRNIGIFDEPLQRAGGENNAFTSTDITNYYETLPSQNIETAFWLEADRMNELVFSEHSLDVQRKVVSEEFKEHYINQPYGDVWHKLRALAYTTHPYQWPTIGKTLEHIEQAQVNDVRNFFFKFYRPNNAILVVAGNVNAEEIFSLAEEWFGVIPPGNTPQKNLPAEPAQKEPRALTVQANVPLDAIYKAWHMPGRLQPGYYAVDLISDLLSGGKSGRLYQVLVKEKNLFSEINCYQNGCIDPGLITVEGKLIRGVKMDEAEKSIVEELEKIAVLTVDEKELTKVKNRVESQMEFSETEILHKAMNLAYTELLGDANLVNEEIKKYLAVTTEEIRQEATNVFKPENCSTLYYFSKN